VLFIIRTLSIFFYVFLISSNVYSYPFNAAPAISTVMSGCNFKPATLTGACPGGWYPMMNACSALTCNKGAHNCPYGTVPSSSTGKCICPTGYTWVSQPNATAADAGFCKPPPCVPPSVEIPYPDNPSNFYCGTPQCPDGFPKDPQGLCPLCPNGKNSNGTCKECPDGSVKQGTISGASGIPVNICQPQCTAPAVWGSVNGIEGCYTNSICPSPLIYATVDGKKGCYPPSNSSSSAGSGGSGDSGSGSGGSGSGGSGSATDNNSSGDNYLTTEDCPAPFVKTGTKCVADSANSDCFTNYHAVIIDKATSYFICVPDNPPPASSSPASSKPSATASAAASSQPTSAASNSASAASSGTNASSGTAASSGSNTSSGTGTGSGTNGSSGSTASQGAGQCDPTAKNYDTCMGRDKSPTDADKQSVINRFNSDVKGSLDSYSQTEISDINEHVSDGVPFAHTVNTIKETMLSFIPRAQSCHDLSFDLPHVKASIQCEKISWVKSVIAWFLSILCIFDLWRIATRPVER
jgi:uncharacterized membrane protein YgcG